MITFFTHCRPFEGEFKELQQAAIRSWRAAIPGCQVILMGDYGTVLGAALEQQTEFALIKTNDLGTALVNRMFYTAHNYAANDLLCEISSDIVLGDDFMLALIAIADIEKPFVIGQRWDIGEGAEAGSLHPPNGIDYFIYRRGTLGEIPPFAVGRTAYDNWLVWAAMEQWGMTVINATDTITAIHINHNYPEYGNKEKMLQSEERKENYRLAYETGCRRWYDINDAPHVMRAGKVFEKEFA